MTCKHPYKRYLLLPDHGMVGGPFTTWCRDCGALYYIGTDKFQTRARWYLPRASSAKPKQAASVAGRKGWK